MGLSVDVVVSGNLGTVAIRDLVEVSGLDNSDGVSCEGKARSYDTARVSGSNNLSMSDQHCNVALVCMLSYHIIVSVVVSRTSKRVAVESSNTLVVDSGTEGIVRCLGRRSGSE